MAITFDNIAGGELAEKFKMALAQIGRNILDPNMDSESARGMNFADAIAGMPKAISSRITIIG